MITIIDNQDMTGEDLLMKIQTKDFKVHFLTIFCPFSKKYMKIPASLLHVVPGETDISSTKFLKKKIINFVKKTNWDRAGGTYINIVKIYSFRESENVLHSMRSFKVYKYYKYTFTVQ